jgi:hypothetical protein
VRTKIPAVIVLAEKQRAAVESLVKYCEELDGTKIVVLEAPEYTNLPYPKCNDASFHYAAEQFKGKPFIWMEPDSIPLKPNWQQTLTDEYHRGGLEFMLSSDSHPPYDVIGGIGVYGPNTSWLIPKTFQKNAWDMWMFNHMKSITHFTPLIQHSYGRYANGKATPHRFPKDSRIIRPESVIFHRDKFQDLITGGDPRMKQNVFKHGGDLGDIIAALPILRHMGGGRVILFHDPNALEGKKSRESLEGARYEAIKPLLEAQDYVDSVEWGEGIDTTNFRTVLRPKFESLTERQARHADMWPIDISPWLTVPEFEAHGKVIFARSLRYHNPIPFPWKEALETYGEKTLFVGLPAEHEEFEKHVGRSIELAKTDNLLDVAKLMAGSPQIIANQSCPAWIALGLGRKLILEGNPDVPNTQLPRPGCFFAYTPSDMQTLIRAFAAAKKK